MHQYGRIIGFVVFAAFIAGLSLYISTQPRAQPSLESATQVGTTFLQGAVEGVVAGAASGAGSGGSGGGFAGQVANSWVRGFMMMAESFTVLSVQQTQMIGSFLDAKHQLETQRLFQQLQARAHKDYHPSEQICRIGTNVRGLSGAQAQLALTSAIIDQSILGRETRSGDRAPVNPGASDLGGRLEDFRRHYCQTADRVGGIVEFCKDIDPQAAGDKALLKARKNIDVDYTRLLEVPLTLEANFLDAKASDTEEDVFQLVNHLFVHRSFDHIPTEKTDPRIISKRFLDMRSIIAMRGVARNSIANIVAQKASNLSEDNGKKVTPFLTALLSEMGMPEDEAVKMIGANPSYFAQMEILAKKIYQDPNFYTNLYDKPANVERIRAAMHAVKLMQDRDIYEALMRREMLFSMLLELKIRNKENPVKENPV